MSVMLMLVGEMPGAAELRAPAGAAAFLQKTVGSVNGLATWAGAGAACTTVTTEASRARSESASAPRRRRMCMESPLERWSVCVVVLLRREGDRCPLPRGD